MNECRSDLRAASRLMEEYALEFEVEFQLEGYEDGWRCAVWSPWEEDGETIILIAYEDLPAAGSAVAAVEQAVALLREKMMPL